MKLYRFRMENLKGERRTLTIECHSPSNVIAKLAEHGWLVQVHYECERKKT